MQVYPFDEPWETMYSGQQAEALNRDFYASNDQLRKLRPPLPQIHYLPPRFGYPSYDVRQPNIMQVFGIDRAQPAMLPDVEKGRNVGFPKEREDMFSSSDTYTGYNGIGSGGWGGSGA